MDIKESNTYSQFSTNTYESPPVECNVLPKYSDPGRYMIYECGGFCGGLGDRQAGIVATYLLSLLTNRTFGIKHSSPMDITLFLQPNKLNWNIKDTKLYGLSNENHMLIGRPDFLKKLPDLKVEKFFSKDVVYFRTNYEYVRTLRFHYNAHRVFPYIMRMTNSEIYNCVLRSLFKLETSLKEKLEIILKKNINGRKLVCAHVRMGKNPSIPKDSEQRLIFNETNSLWAFLDRFNVYKRYAIFVASDSYEIKKYAHDRFPLQIVDVPGPIIHIDQIGNRKEIEGIRKVFIEQNLLSRCDVLVITKSGFSRIAAYLRNSSRDLYCYLKGIVIPCRHDLLDQIYLKPHS